jgi:hypothetical protein
MGIADIIFIVEVETGCTLTDMIKAQRGIAYDAKCVAAMMVHEEGQTDKKPFADLLKVERNTVYTYINRTNTLLSAWPGMSGYNKGFKMLYLACNTRRVWLEERPDIKFVHVKLKGGVE